MAFNTKMVHSVTLLLAILMTINAVTSQTFQYSRGWTNGKRAVSDTFGNGLPSELKINFPVQGLIHQTNDPDTIHCGLKKLRMLLRGNTNDQFYHLPCELLNILPKVDIKEDTKNTHHSDFYDIDDNSN